MHTVLRKKSVLFYSSIIIASAILIGLAIFFTIRVFKVKSARANLDVNDKNSIIALLEYDSKDTDTVFEIASLLFDEKNYSDCARVCLYALQYLGESTDFTSLLQSAYEKLGASTFAIKSFDGASFNISAFDVTSCFGDDGYGIANGIYCSFYGGHAKAKISAIMPISISACENGVYVLDSSDSLLKLLSKDGASVSVINEKPIREFVYFNGLIYFIDGDGIPHGSIDAKLNNGEFTAGLHISNGEVLCNVYGPDYNNLRQIKIG